MALKRLRGRFCKHTHRELKYIAGADPDIWCVWFCPDCKNYILYDEDKMQFRTMNGEQIRALKRGIITGIWKPVYDTKRRCNLGEERRIQRVEGV